MTISLLLTACGGLTTVELTADKTIITAGGIEYATITARAMINGSPASAGTIIALETNGGSFSPVSELQSTELSTLGDGTVTLKLYSGATQGSGTITATVDDDATGLSGTGSLTITFGEATGGKKPVAGTFTMTCNAVNIGALRTPLPDTTVICNLAARSRDGTSIPTSAFTPTFMAEAGSLSTGIDPDTGVQVVLYTPDVGTPKDVDPDPLIDEPSTLSITGLTHNPRDGLVTLVAIIDGEESFTDSNGNGEYDLNEQFDDGPEPFVDTNDNGIYDAEDTFQDLNGNGKWDQLNGVYDSNTKIMAIYKILWTGKLESGTGFAEIKASTASTKVPNGGSISVDAYVVDTNLNPVAAFQDNGDYAEWTLNSTGDAELAGDTSTYLSNALGFTFNKTANTELARWMILEKSFTKGKISATVRDSDPEADSAKGSFTLGLTLYSTPGPTADGGHLSQLTEQIATELSGSSE